MYSLLQMRNDFPVTESSSCTCQYSYAEFQDINQHEVGCGHHDRLFGDSGESFTVDAYLQKSCERPASGYLHDMTSNRTYGLFHAHAHDMKFLDQWMEELLDLKQDGHCTNGVRHTS